jgi:MSHA pilin protein MshC
LLKLKGLVPEGGRKAAFLFVRVAKMAAMRGFTLVELVVVIVLMAILVGVAAPRFFGQGKFEAPAFAQELASAARYAQKLAVVSGCPVDLTVTASSYALLQPQLTTPVCTGALTMSLPAKHPATGEAFAGSVPTGVAIGGTLGTVQFSAAGVPSAAASFTIDDFTVSIAANSGYVDVQ